MLDHQHPRLNSDMLPSPLIAACCVEPLFTRVDKIELDTSKAAGVDKHLRCARVTCRSRASSKRSAPPVNLNLIWISSS